MITPAKLTSKGQVTIPKEIRDFLLLETGGVVVFEKEKDQVVIRPHKTLKAYRGILKGHKQEASWDEIRHTAKKAVGKRVSEGKK
jgi:AbrB family looped-hinge helix DNA binding protein